jgi:hypothetical protein
MTYKIIRYYAKVSRDNEVIKTGLSLSEAQAHCQDPETSWTSAVEPPNKRRTVLHGEWFDGYVKE